MRVLYDRVGHRHLTFDLIARAVLNALNNVLSAQFNCLFILYSI